MINGIRLNESNLSPNQRRLRLMELGIGTNSLSKKDKKRLQPRECSCEVVSMKEIPINRLQVVPKKVKPQPQDDINLEEILKEMGYGDTEGLGDEVEEDESEEKTISNMSKSELKQIIRDVVTQTLEEDDDDLDFNEIFENLTKNY